MRKAILLVTLLLAAGCSLNKADMEALEGLLTCGLSVEEVQVLGQQHGATRIECFRPGGGPPLLCTVAWGKRGVTCTFNKQERLVSYHFYRQKPLTQVIQDSEVMLCD